VFREGDNINTPSGLDAPAIAIAKVNMYDDNKELIEIELQKEANVFPLDKAIFMFISYILLLVITFIKGSEHMNSIFGIQS